MQDILKDISEKQTKCDKNICYYREVFSKSTVHSTTEYRVSVEPYRSGVKLSSVWMMVSGAMSSSLTALHSAPSSERM